MKILEANKGEKLHDISLDIDFLGRILRVLITKAKLAKLDSMKLKTTGTEKKIITKVKIKIIYWEKNGCKPCI